MMEGIIVHRSEFHPPGQQTSTAELNKGLAAEETIRMSISINELYYGKIMPAIA